MQVPLEFGAIRCGMPIRPYLRTGQCVQVTHGERLHGYGNSVTLFGFSS